MKRFALCLLLLLPIGCATATAPTPPLAPGYTSPTDQSFGQSLKAAHDLANQAVLDYGKLTPAQQQTEKAALNGFVAAVNAADAIYLVYHQSQATAAQVTAALNSVIAAQTKYTTIATGGK